VSQKPHFILLGPPGSGKGTQAKILASKIGYCHLSTGDLIRAQIKTGTPLGLKIKSIVESGEFPKDEIVIKLVTLFMKICSTGVIFDGFPRTLSQAKAFMELLPEKQAKLIFSVHIDVPEDVIINRLTKRYMCEGCGAIYSDDFSLKRKGVCTSCGSTSFMRRKDDQKEAVKTRLSVYSKQTRPMVDFLSEKLPFFIVDGMQELEKVTCDILEALERQKNLIRF
jgi:adenylate kinase